MHQAPDLLALATRLHAALPGFSFGMFTGYTEDELESGTYWTREDAGSEVRRALWTELRNYFDFAVLGRYNEGLRTDEPLRTSKNQVLRSYSSRFTKYDFDSPQVEVTIEPPGLVTITGFPVAGLPS